MAVRDEDGRAVVGPGAGDELADRELLARTSHGDLAAFHKLYARYYHPLLRFIYRLTGDFDAAQEGVNDVMLVVWHDAAKFGGRSKLSTWIMGIAYRKSLKLFNKASRWTSRFKAAEWSENIEPQDRLREHTDETIDRDLLYHAMRMLSPQHRAVVELTYFHGYSYEEIATIVDCPVNTVKTRMFHARAKLKAVLPSLSNDETQR